VSNRPAPGGRLGPARPLAGGRAADAAIGIIANPMSGRDIRRLVARASVFPNAEKTNMVLRLIAAAGALGVGRVMVSTDTFGISAGVLRAAERRGADHDQPWPAVEFVALDGHTGTAEDTRETTRRMRAAGANVVVLLGGDGTVRAAAAALGGTPVVPLSTGTNNAFPQMWEATVAGSAAALVALGAVPAGEVTHRAKALEVTSGARRELALVDVCVSTVAHVGARALWHVDTLRELYCAFAEPHAVGLSSVAAMLLPTSRRHPGGVAVRLAGDGPAERWVTAPIAPGVLARVGIVEAGPLAIGERRRSAVPAGTVAVDGEREIEFGPDRPVFVTLSGAGPLVVDIPAVMHAAAERDLLVSAQLPVAPAPEPVSEPRSPIASDDPATRR
jgi:predicted polyphosphate/ATP-dependent NAD kinase